MSPTETLEVVARGDLLALDYRNSKHAFSSRALDALRNQVVDFIATEIVNEMGARGASEERVVMALERAFSKQFAMSRGPAENVIEFDQGNKNGGFVNGVGTGVGIAAGGLGAYGAYRYWKGRRNPDGTPMLPGPGTGGADADGYVDVTPPKPNAPSGGSAMGERHPGPPRGALTTASPTPDVARQTAGQIAGQDALGQAVRKGKQAIAARGSSILRAIRGAI